MGNRALDTMRKLRSYIAAYEKTLEGQNIDESYEGFFESLSVLSTLLERLYQLDEHNNPVKMSEDDLTRLQTSYLTAITDGLAVLKKGKTSKIEKKLNANISNILDIVRKDYDVIESANLNEDVPLPVLIDRARKRVLEVNAPDIKKVKGKLSSRIPIKFTDQYGIEKEGFASEIHLKDENAAAYLDSPDGTGIESRNYAMSQVAKLLGRSRLLAKSELMTIKVNGEEKEYNFMDTAYGSDMSRPKEGDPIYKWSLKGQKKLGNDYVSEHAISGKALMQLADIEVLDFICTNKDRHAGNLLYKFDTTDPENPVLDEVIGIDNDHSFHTSAVRSNDTNTTQLENIMFMSRSMADALMTITKAELTIFLADAKLSAAEIDVAYENIEKLKAKIIESDQIYADTDDLTQLKDGKMRVIPDDKFNELNYQRLREMNEWSTIYSRVWTAAFTASDTYEWMEKNNKFGKMQIAYNEARVIKEPVRSEREIFNDKIASFENQLEANDPFFHINTASFRKMKNELAALSTALSGGELNDADLKKQLVSLYKASEAYIEAKNDEPSSDFGKNRLETAKQIRDFTYERLAKYAKPEYIVNDALAENYDAFKLNIKNLGIRGRLYNHDKKAYDDHMAKRGEPGWTNAPLLLIGLQDNEEYLNKAKESVRKELSELIYIKLLDCKHLASDEIANKVSGTSRIAGGSTIRVNPAFNAYIRDIDGEKFFNDTKNMNATEFANYVVNGYQQAVEKVRAQEAKEQEKGGIEIGGPNK